MTIAAGGFGSPLLNPLFAGGTGLSPQIALNLIQRYGETVVWREQTQGVPVDGAKPWEAGATTTKDNNVDMVFLPEHSESVRQIKRRPDTEIPTNMLFGLMAPYSEFSPDLNDIVERTINGSCIQYRVSYIEILKPGATTFLYTIGLMQ